MMAQPIQTPESKKTGMRMEGIVLHLATLLLILLAVCALAATAELIADGGAVLDRGDVGGATAQVCLPGSASAKSHVKHVAGALKRVF